MVAEIWSKKKPATVAVVHWPESTDRQRMGLGEDTRVSNGEGQIETAGRGAGVGQGSRADLGHVGIHRIPISRVLLISPAGDAEVPAIALSGSTGYRAEWIASPGREAGRQTGPIRVHTATGRDRAEGEAQ